MDVIGVIELLKKYKMFDDAQNECKRRKIDEAPYDMKGHHEVYCSYLSQKRVELQHKRDDLRKVKCVEYDNIPDNLKPVHDDCFFVGMCCTKDYCETECTYYQQNIAPLDQEISEIAEAEKVLKEEGERDFLLK